MRGFEMPNLVPKEEEPDKLLPANEGGKEELKEIVDDVVGDNEGERGKDVVLERVMQLAHKEGIVLQAEGGHEKEMRRKWINAVRALTIGAVMMLGLATQAHGEQYHPNKGDGMFKLVNPSTGEYAEPNINKNAEFKFEVTSEAEETLESWGCSIDPQSKIIRNPEGSIIFAFDDQTKEVSIVKTPGMEEVSVIATDSFGNKAEKVYEVKLTAGYDDMGNKVITRSKTTTSIRTYSAE